MRYPGIGQRNCWMTRRIEDSRAALYLELGPKHLHFQEGLQSPVYVSVIG